MKDILCCCVCLKEEPFENNPIVSCDGKNCSTIVHKACYGIQQIPDGAWFCQKCISQERTARVRCELCPSRDGALKHTNKGGWCHIICALFVPGAEFLDTERLETISVDKVLSDKLNKMCSICEKNNRLDRATVGACIQCVKSGCKILFHVTCAQSQGLLTEIVNSKEGVRYVAFCFNHKHKTKHRDFSIRLSNSSHYSSSRHEKNKLRQTPPQLEKSDEDCVTPQDVSLDTDHSSSSKHHLNISSSSGGNANFSSDSTSFDDSNDRIAPVICNSSDIATELASKKNLPRSASSVHSTKKSLDILRPPNITTLESDACSMPPNLCCSDASESVAKQEATVKSSTGSVTSDASSVRPLKRQATTSSNETQPKKAKCLKSEQKLIVKTEMTTKPDKIKKTRKVSQNSKTTAKGSFISKFDSDKIQALVEMETRRDKKMIPPARPTSLYNTMNSIMGGTSASGTSSSMTATSSSGGIKMSGTTCQSMEELLEWQWDQTGTLLMQQAEASDIASLLSCLHDLKSENEQLLSKQYKLSHRRDHLKAVNAKLQLQLSKTSLSSTAVTPAPLTAATGIDNRSVASGRQQQIPQVQHTNPKPISSGQVAPVAKQSSKPMPDQSSFKHQQHSQQQQPQSIPISMPSIAMNGGDLRIRQLSDSGKSMFLQPQLQQQQMITTGGGGGGSVNSGNWGASSVQKTCEQPINHQAFALLKHYQQQQHGTPIASTQPVSQTDLVTFLNNQLHSQLAQAQPAGTAAAAILTSNATAVQDIHVVTNNGVTGPSNMELIYQAIQHKKQQQLQIQQQQQQQQQHTLPSHFFYNTTTSKMPVGTGPAVTANVIGTFTDGSIVPQLPDTPLARCRPNNQRTRPSESLCQQIRSAKPSSTNETL